MPTSRMTHPVALLVDELLRLTPRLRSVFSDAAAAADLSRMDITVLAAVIEASVAPTVPQIGRSLGHPRQVIQRSANTLMAKGLIEAVANPDHKRAPRLVATDAGGHAKALVDARATIELDKLLAVLTPEVCDRLTEELRAARGRTEQYLRKRDAHAE